jgi:hypothetical protein
MPVDDLLKAGIIAYQLEDLALARSCLSKAVSADPGNASAWLWLGRCLTDPEQKRYCYQQAVNLEGDNLTARQALEDMNRQPAVPPPPRAIYTAETDPVVQPQAIVQSTEAPTQEVPLVAAPPAATPPLPRKPIQLPRGLLIGGVGVMLLVCTALVVLLVLPRLGGSALPVAPSATLPVALPTATQTIRPSSTPFPATWTMTATLTRRPSSTPLPTSTESVLSMDEMHSTQTAQADQKPTQTIQASQNTEQTAQATQRTTPAAPPHNTPERPTATIKPIG